MRIILLFSFLSLALFIVGCKCDDPRDPDCDNYDPCIDAVELTGEFKVFQFTFYDSFLDTFFLEVDTPVDEVLVQFRALDQADHYLWKIGDDPREFTTRRVDLNFEGFSGDIEVSLRTWNDESSRVQECLSINDSLSSSSKVYRLEDIPNLFDEEKGPQAYFGDYRGYYVDEPDAEVNTFIRDGRVDLGDIASDSNTGGIYDFPRGCNNIFYEEAGKGLCAIIPLWNSFFLKDPYGIAECQNYGVGRYDQRTQEVVIEYWYNPSHSSGEIPDTIRNTFIAKKI